MAATAASRAAIWTLPEFDRIEILYRVSDVWADKGADPHIAQVQYIGGEIRGSVSDEDGESTERVPLGDLQLARIDLWRLDEEGEALLSVLDSASSEWINLYDQIGLDHSDEGELTEGVRYLVIADRVTLIPEARGHGLGVHVLAQALRTWADHDTLVVLTAAPTEGTFRTKGLRAQACERIAAHWCALGLDRLDLSGRASPPPEPILYARSEWRRYDDALQTHSAWVSPGFRRRPASASRAASTGRGRGRSGP